MREPERENSHTYLSLTEYINNTTDSPAFTRVFLRLKQSFHKVLTKRIQNSKTAKSNDMNQTAWKPQMFFFYASASFCSAYNCSSSSVLSDISRHFYICLLFSGFAVFSSVIHSQWLSVCLFAQNRFCCKHFTFLCLCGKCHATSWCVSGYFMPKVSEQTDILSHCLSNFQFFANGSHEIFKNTGKTPLPGMHLICSLFITIFELLKRLGLSLGMFRNELKQSRFSIISF